MLKPPKYYGKTLFLKWPLDENKFKNLKRRKKKLLIKFLSRIKPLDKGVCQTQATFEVTSREPLFL
jgi:hypothetical protein